ncbi:MAG TPA: folylpolyglutamate synthase/dihydrofolate synthase family protein [Anaerolineae bacterium]|nr:folylpolyglutamate synthase/dihydrofolate synthase family protein [Anaerolineae bacterium]HQK13993.1 folylpolyglutamate synthase/dihydrofolate synthase family protein [Anaerolineae bacterium]
MEHMEYHQALRYLYGLVDYEKRRIEHYSPREFKLERVFAFMEKLGNPHRAYPTLHIAGTKGKGSVSAMLAAVAQAAGLRTALYTSPHLHTYRERIQINGEPIPRDSLAALLTEIRPAIESIEGLTLFEATTGLAFLYFARQNVDIGVIEVGLGGRLDATNVVIPEVSIITSLSLDHTHVLGSTVTEIAREKGGIIKPGVPVISAPQEPQALAVLRAIAAEQAAPLTVVGQDWTWESLHYDLEGQTMATHRVGAASDFDGRYALSLLGDFQQENAMVAIAALEALQATGHSWATPQVAHAGLKRAQWPGRMEILQRDPPIVIDCAHNPYSAQTLVHSLARWFPGIRWNLIFGSSTDKDIDGVLQALLPISEHVLVTHSYHPRATAPEVLAQKCALLDKTAEIVASPAAALELAREQLEPGQGILATGSIFLVADVRTAWGKEANLSLPLGDWEDEPW